MTLQEAEAKWPSYYAALSTANVFASFLDESLSRRLSHFMPTSSLVQHPG